MLCSSPRPNRPYLGSSPTTRTRRVEWRSRVKLVPHDTCSKCPSNRVRCGQAARRGKWHERRCWPSLMIPHLIDLCLHLRNFTMQKKQKSASFTTSDESVNESQRLGEGMFCNDERRLEEERKSLRDKWKESNRRRIVAIEWNIRKTSIRSEHEREWRRIEEREMKNSNQVTTKNRTTNKRERSQQNDIDTERDNVDLLSTSNSSIHSARTSVGHN